MEMRGDAHQRARQDASSSSSSPYHALDRFLSDSLNVVDKRALPEKARVSQEASQIPSPSSQPKTTSSSQIHHPNNVSKSSLEYLAIQERMLQSMQRPGKTTAPSPNTSQPKQKSPAIRNTLQPSTSPKKTPPPAASSGQGLGHPHTAVRSNKNKQSAPSEAGTNAEWWSSLDSKGKGNKKGAGPSSVYSYPETAITDRRGEGSISGSELRQYLDRLESLESQVNEERERKNKFQEELKRINPKAFAALQPILNIARRGAPEVKDSDSSATLGVP